MLLIRVVLQLGTAGVINFLGPAYCISAVAPVIAHERGLLWCKARDCESTGAKLRAASLDDPSWVHLNFCSHCMGLATTIWSRYQQVKVVISGKHESDGLSEPHYLLHRNSTVTEYFAADLQNRNSSSYDTVYPCPFKMWMRLLLPNLWCSLKPNASFVWLRVLVIPFCMACDRPSDASLETDISRVALVYCFVLAWVKYLKSILLLLDGIPRVSS